MSRDEVGGNIEIRGKQNSLFPCYLNIKFICATVKSSFANEDDMRMSKYVFQIANCRFFIESYCHSAVFTPVYIEKQNKIKV